MNSVALPGRLPRLPRGLSDRRPAIDASGVFPLVLFVFRCYIDIREGAANPPSSQDLFRVSKGGAEGRDPAQRGERERERERRA